MPATDEQRARVRRLIDAPNAAEGLTVYGPHLDALAALLADSERLAALRAVERLRQEAERSDAALIPGDTIWTCACGEWWIEDGEGDQTAPAECGRCGREMAVTGRLSDAPLNRSSVAEQLIGSDSLDLIAWSLRLPLLWEQATRVDATPDEQAAERARLDALIAEGERVLGILPPEVE